MHSFVLIVVFFVTAVAHAGVEFSGSGRVRSEDKNRTDFNGKSGPNRMSSTTSRFRLDVKGDTGSGFIFFQPQFTKTAGKNDYLPSGSQTAGGTTTAENSTKGTSGQLYDQRLDVHQAYIDHKLSDTFSLKLGRQEFNYGDQLIIGSVGWHNIARSFDAIRFTYKDGVMDGSTDLWAAKVVDNNVSASSLEDHNFYGLYRSQTLGPIDNFDIYALAKHDVRASNMSERAVLYSGGLRMKSNIGLFDFRLEVTGQKGKSVADVRQSGQQYDIELGYALPFWQSRLAFEYFQASKDYDQMYPTSHKWLGFADLFSRRNIKGYVVHYSSKPMDRWTFKVDYHVLSRVSTSQGAYTFTAGTPAANWGTTKASGGVATELDITLKYDLSTNVGLVGGYSFVTPDAYIKDQDSDNKDNMTFSYLQLVAKF